MQVGDRVFLSNFLIRRNGNTRYIPNRIHNIIRVIPCGARCDECQERTKIILDYYGEGYRFCPMHVVKIDSSGE